MEFSAFKPSIVSFLNEVHENNNRDWFNENKPRYESELREPCLAFIREMAPRLAEISPHFVASDKKSGGSLIRIFRDTRFSKDKTPYKTNVGIQFRHAKGKDVHAPGFYLHIGRDEVYLGMGMWRPDSASLREIRAAIDGGPRKWKKVVKSVSAFNRGGESLKRIPRGYDKDHPLAEDLKRKDHIVSKSWSHSDLYEPGLPDRVKADFAEAASFMKFLCDAIDVPF